MAQIEKREITSELEESYLDYAMSVIVSRALPDVRDGLKPVQRRILWAMWSSGLTADAKLRKSANVIGEVMGKYHPHGDTAIYDSLVRMAQDFSLRYPLVVGQGNWGSVDGDNAAAMRYTETKLSKISAELLTDIEKETVPWQENYDASRTEPKVLPAKLPHLLLNGAVGIAVGMATNIPPHNLGEVIDATIHLAGNQKATSGDLMEFVQGPDFPTGGIIYDQKAIKEVYIHGKGPITARGVAEVVSTKKTSGKDAFSIVITEIPYQVNKAEMIIKIASLVQDKRIEGIRDLRDESDKDGMRIVIDVKNDASPQKILNQLYKHTDLQKDFHMNMIALADGIQPQVMSLRDVLEAYLDHRKVVVKKRAEFELRKAEERAHILEGLSKALTNIDKVIQTIKQSKDKEEAHGKLQKQFKLSAIQATAILEMRLQTLAALERKKIDEELKEKKRIIAELTLLIKDPKKILKVVVDELKELKEKYSDERRTRVVKSGLKDFREEDLIPQEETIITFSQSGYIKRLLPGTLKSQHRGGKGLIGSGVGEDDFLMSLIAANTHDNILFFTDQGRVFRTKVYEIPAVSRTAKGKPVHNFLQIPTNESVSAIITYPSNEQKKAQPINDDNAWSQSVAATSPSQFLVMLTKDGMMKKTALSEFENVRRTGIIAISLKKSDRLIHVKVTSGKDEMVITTKDGQSIRFKEAQIRPMGRTASGVRAMKLRSGDEISSVDIVRQGVSEKTLKLLVVMEKGFGKLTSISQYKIQKRGGSGIKTAKCTPKTGHVIVARLVSDEKELIALSAKGQIIRTSLEKIRTAGRATQGVKIMSLNGGDTVVGAVCL
ncbi:MAG: DNA gyrase subunit A [Candidatus Harrisonbacteria bacterium CG10_big_fil_rev_8_21_14_0_10_42_17]|uniref:DNA gyrase subunit A n=1 Tax=Candidatus Harrisonbacteria bacterium CG10_big_fil_rev_8_21_14_0_10_42_17 TaxID=1974584 RepID=A0A2M6WIV1_9BACT|nr:MAG: DNA gyrase subunit A [Candidatus Harrisonbacteria bacterium CG10_big_fil_rev_8_21_14_0_10_42_17]